MPVLLKTKVDSETDPREISLDEYEQGRTNFTDHYYLANCVSSFGGQDIAISWDSLNAAVTSFITAHSVNPNNVAMRFVYCFDTGTNCLYLRLQILTMQVQSPGSNTYSLIASPCAWYEISEGSFTTTTDTDLYDNTYLNTVYYCVYAGQCDPQTLEPLSGDGGNTFARTVTFPWKSEINLMYVDNGSPTGASLCFGACSYFRPGQGGEMDLYPHGMVLYLRTSDGTDLLNDQSYVVLFENKGADMGTLCPTDCGVYIAPTV